MKRIAAEAFMGLGLARFAIDAELDRDRVRTYYSGEIEGYAERLERGEEIAIFVAEDRGELTGYIVVSVDPDLSKQFGMSWGRIVSLAIQPEYQGRGIGKSLVAKGVDWLRLAHVYYVEVLTDQNNVAAQRVYEGMGFRAVYSSITLSMRL